MGMSDPVTRDKSVLIFVIASPGTNYSGGVFPIWIIINGTVSVHAFMVAVMITGSVHPIIMKVGFMRKFFDT